MDLIAVLHNVRSLHNVGSIFRTADGAGVRKIYLCGITPAPVDAFGRPRRQLAKVSLGAEKSVEWEKVSSTARLLKKLKNPPVGGGYRIFAIEQAKNSVLFYKTRSMKAGLRSRTRKKARAGTRVALVVGNEVKGLPPSVLKIADEILEIPMRGRKESLNVSVAFGIVAYHISGIIK